MSKGLILLTSSIFLVYGFLFVVIPVEMLLYVTEGHVSSASSVIDIRATYGGMSIGVAIILYVLSRDRSNLWLGLFSVLILMTVMAVARTIGIIIDGSASTLMYVYLLLEIVAASLSLVLLKSSERHNKAIK
jgi:hypothetical protein